MRWFIEVSRVGENNPTEKYCLEAKQWQAALQEARKLRGDAGPLSKFSIELLDEGYRAVDPTLKIRYIVAKAPHDAPISVPGTNGASAHAPVVEPAPRTEPMASPEPLPVPSPAEAAPKTDPMGAPPPSAAAASKQAAATVRAPAPAAASQPPRIVVPPDPVPPPKATPSPAPMAVTHPTQRSLEVAKAPDFQLIRKREEEPSQDSPIAYREYAYAVKPGTDRQSAEVLLWLRFREIQSALEERPNGKFVQLAVFDHVFERKPVRPPLATLAWKDWRGEPVLKFTDPEAAAKANAEPPPRASSVPPRPNPSVAPVSIPAAAAAPAPISIAPAAAPAPISIAPASAPEISVEVSPESVPIPSESVPPWPTSAPSEPPAAKQPSVPPASQQPSVPRASQQPSAAPAAAKPSAAPAAAKPSAAPAAAKPSEAPVSKRTVQEQARAHAEAQARALAEAEAAAAIPRRRKPGEDLIGDLFEAMHELHFAPDVVTGAQFVLGIAQRLLPSSGIIVHVFDINTRHFVVVRAAGPNAAQVLLQRTPDQEPLFAEAMRRTRCLRFDDATKDDRFSGGRWAALGVQPSSVLVGPVQQGGRYLGVVELANPDGDTPYHEGEANALDYICEQFAEFIAARPIIVDADVVIGKA